MRAILALGAALLATPALAASCDRFSDPLAYNACLARQGPAARAVPVGSAPPERAKRPIASGRVLAGHRHGRAELVFTPGK